jgi:aspartate aminotransferase-like enzyme
VGRLDLAGRHSETSTGVVHDVQAIAERTSGSGALVVVDAVSSLGAVPLETDAWGIDVVVSGSQKALMTPPGLRATRSTGSAQGAWRRRPP